MHTCSPDHAGESSSRDESCAVALADVKRAAIPLLLNLDAHSRVLDLTFDGWNFLGWALAGHVGQVDIVDIDPERLQQFAAHARQTPANHPADLTYSSADKLPKLPFADEQFDAVLLHGSLAHLPRHVSGAPHRTQEQFLTEVRRVLKQTGTLSLAVDNRYSYTNLADTLLRWRHARRDRGHAHSFGGYRAMLTRAGLRGQATYMAYPDYRQPRYLLPIEPPDVSARVWSDLFRRQFAPIRRGGLGTLGKRFASVASRSRWARRFAPSFVIIAGASSASAAASTGPAERIIRHALGKKAVGLMLLVRHSHAAIVPTYLPDRDAMVYVKIPLSDDGNAALARHFDFLELLDRKYAGQIPAPRPLARGTLDNHQHYYVESALDGAPGSRLAAGATRLLDQAAELITGVHCRTRAGHATEVAARWETRLTELSHHPGVAASPEWGQVVRRFRQRVADLPCTVMAHHDYYLENVIFDDRGRAIGILDWDAADEHGLPAVDLIHLMASALKKRYRLRDAAALEQFSSGRHPKFAQMFQAYCRRLELEPDLADWLSLYVVVRVWRMANDDRFAPAASMEYRRATDDIRDLLRWEGRV